MLISNLFAFPRVIRKPKNSSKLYHFMTRWKRDTATARETKNLIPTTQNTFDLQQLMGICYQNSVEIISGITTQRTSETSDDPVRDHVKHISWWSWSTITFKFQLIFWNLVTHPHGIPQHTLTNQRFMQISTWISLFDKSWHNSGGSRENDSNT